MKGATVKKLPLSHKRLYRLVEEVLGRGGEIEIRAVGHSMIPSILPGERVVLGPFDPSGPEPGQIVLAWTGRRLVLHRLVRLDGRAVLAADNSSAPVIRVRPENLAGRVVRVRRGIGGIVRRSSMAMRAAAGRLLRKVLESTRMRESA